MSNSVDYIVAIPARYGSSRLAGKPLALVDGEPMIVKVCKKALESSANQVIACVDHDEVAKALESLALENKRLVICMTDSAPRSGTERIAQMLKLKNIAPDTIVVNVQGDEPLITKDHIDEVANPVSYTHLTLPTIRLV